MLDEKKAPFAEAPVNDSCLIVRRFPPHNTCAGRLLVELLLDQVVTPRSGDDMTHSMRTAAYIHRLRRWGWPIATELRYGSNKYEVVRFAEYRMEVEIGPREAMYIETAKRDAAEAAFTLDVDIPGVGMG